MMTYHLATHVHIHEARAARAGRERMKTSRDFEPNSYRIAPSRALIVTSMDTNELDCARALAPLIPACRTLVPQYCTKSGP